MHTPEVSFHEKPLFLVPAFSSSFAVRTKCRNVHSAMAVQVLAQRVVPFTCLQVAQL